MTTTTTPILPSFYTPESLMDEDFRAEVEAFQAAQPVFLNAKGEVLPYVQPGFLMKDTEFAWETKPGDKLRLELLAKWGRHMDIAEKRLEAAGVPSWRWVYVLKFAGTSVSWVELWRAELMTSATMEDTIRSDSCATVIDGYDITAVRRFYENLVRTAEDVAEWLEYLEAKQLPGAGPGNYFSTAALSKVSDFCEESSPAYHGVLFNGEEHAWTHEQIRNQCKLEGVACHPHFERK